MVNSVPQVLFKAPPSPPEPASTEDTPRLRGLAALRIFQLGGFTMADAYAAADSIPPERLEEFLAWLT